MRRLVLAASAALVAFILNAGAASAQATRTWVSGVGDDANPCSRTAPCKTFAGAISKTAPNGIINCIDPGGFGAVTITKSITIDCSMTFAGVLGASTNAINVNAAGIVVTLRNLSIEGAASGLIGVNFISGSALHIENCRIFGFQGGAGLGIKFSPPAGVSGELYVSDTTISDNGNTATNGGILIQPAGGGANVVLNRVQIFNNSSGIRLDGTGATGAINVHLRDSVVSGSPNNGITATTPLGGSPIAMTTDRTYVSGNAGVGVTVNAAVASGAGSAIIRIGSSTIAGNVTGVSATGAGVLNSYKNNEINGNGTDGTPINQANLN